MRDGDDEGVSPVIGTILVLAITIVGIVALMMWGGPMVDRVQSQNAEAAVFAEFEGLLDATADLSVPDHSRFPALSAPRGRIALEDGTRIMVTADHDPANPNCDLHVTGWASTTATNQVTVAAPNCRAVTATSFEVYAVSGTTLSKKDITVTNGGTTVTATGPGTVDFSEGDWLFRITDGASNPTVYAEAWLHTGDRITWRLESASGTRDLSLESGAIFSSDGATTFLRREPAIGDVSFGSGYYGLWLRTYVATSLGSVEGDVSHQVFVSLASNDLHVGNKTTYKLRFDFAGELAEAWCETMLQRNPAPGTPFDGVILYDDDNSFSCSSGGTQGIRSVTFRYLSNAAFQFWFLHARITFTLID